jgi:TRAP transporter TAXI family solute receptor
MKSLSKPPHNFSLIFGMATLVLGSLACAAPKTSLTLGSTNITSSHFVVSDAMAKAITAGIPGAHVSHIETGASVDNIRRLTKGELDLGLVATDAAIEAINGTGVFKGKAVPDLVALYAYDVSTLNVAVTQDSKVTDLGQLQGKKFNPGIRGSGAEQLTRQVFTTLGIEPNLVPGTVKDAVEGVQNRQLVGYSKYGPGHGVDATLRELIVTTPMRLLSFTAAQQEKISSHIKGVGFTKIVNVMEGQPPVNTPSVLIVYATRTALMDDDTAYAIAKSIYDNRAMLIQAWPHLKDFDFKAQALAAEKVGIKLHPGAKRFWESLK